MMPGENSPPMHPHCRCSVAAYEDSEDYEKWLDYLDKGGTTEEWNRMKESRESVAKAGKGGIINSGGTSGAKKTPGWQDRHAEREYASIRKKTTDCNNIAKNTGALPEDVETVKKHMFIEEHLFADGSVRRFDADYDQAQAWDRLSQGTHTDTDVLLLKHEMEEARLMREQNLPYEEAHKLANQKYNWWAAFLKGE